MKEKVTDLNEKEEMINKVKYCDYIHVQFWGKHFSPELTHELNGFIMRRKYRDSEPSNITGPLKAMFHDVLERPGKSGEFSGIQSRPSHKTNPGDSEQKPLHE